MTPVPTSISMCCFTLPSSVEKRIEAEVWALQGGSSHPMNGSSFVGGFAITKFTTLHLSHVHPSSREKACPIPLIRTKTLLFILDFLLRYNDLHKLPLTHNDNLSKRDERSNSQKPLILKRRVSGQSSCFCSATLCVFSKSSNRSITSCLSSISLSKAFL